MSTKYDSDPFIKEMPRGYLKQPRSENDNPLNHSPIVGLWGEPEPDNPNPKSIILGRDSSGQFLSITDNRHMITFAGSRAGKGVSLIIPNMLSYAGSVFAIDPKGELATITAARRGNGSEYAHGMNGKVFVLDPYKRVEGSAIEYRSSFNPLTDLDHETDLGLTYATMIADGLVIQETGNTGHFTASARSFLRGLILYVCATEVGASRSLIRVRELISQPEKDFEAMLKHMVELGGVIGRAATSLQLKSSAERASVVSTADVQTDFLEDGAMRDVLCEHDFDLKDLKGETPTTIYLCLPAGRLATHGRWLRLMIALAMEAIEETGAIGENEVPALFVLDEAAALGHMATLEKAAGQIAGFGCKIWSIYQDINQIKRDYKDSWETFIGNAGYVTAFGVSDLSTTEYLSKILGKTEVKTFTTSSSVAVGGKTVSGSQPINVVDLLAPHEVSLYFGRSTDRILIKQAGKPPWVIDRIKYYQDFIGYFDPAPGHKAPPTLADIQAVKDAQTAEERAEDERREAEIKKRDEEAAERQRAREEALKQAAETGKAAIKQAGKFAKFMGDKLNEGMDKMKDNSSDSDKK